MTESAVLLCSSGPVGVPVGSRMNVNEHRRSQIVDVKDSDADHRVATPAAGKLSPRCDYRAPATPARYFPASHVALPFPPVSRSASADDRERMNPSGQRSMRCRLLG